MKDANVFWFGNIHSESISSRMTNRSLLLFFYVVGNKKNIQCNFVLFFFSCGLNIHSTIRYWITKFIPFTPFQALFVANQFQFGTGQIQFVMGRFQVAAGQVRIVADQIEYVQLKFNVQFQYVQFDLSKNLALTCYRRDDFPFWLGGRIHLPFACEL